MATVVIALYMLANVIYNAPPSPAQIRVLPLVNRIMNPYFAQAWTLFAPMPPTFNGHIDLQARIRRPNGSIVYTSVVGTWLPAQLAARGDRLLPSKLPDIGLAFQETFTSYANTLAALRSSSLPAPEKHQAERRLDELFGSSFAELGRYLSAEATVTFRRDRVLAVRGILAETPVVPFSKRYQNPAPRQPTKVILATRWMPFDPEVTG